MADEQLFETADDELLISVYERQGRTLDDLPYTAEFERIYEAMVGDGSGAEPMAAVSRADLFHRLHNLRKAARLPRLGRTPAAPPRIDDEQEVLLIDLVQSEIERISLRDRLPYTNTFDRIVTAFNAQAGMSLTPHDVWRLIAKLAK